MVIVDEVEPCSGEVSFVQKLISKRKMGSKSGRIGLNSANSTAAAARRAMYINTREGGDSTPAVNNEYLLYKPKPKHTLASAVTRFSKGSQPVSDTKTGEHTLILSTDQTMQTPNPHYSQKMKSIKSNVKKNLTCRNSKKISCAFGNTAADTLERVAEMMSVTYGESCLTRETIKVLKKNRNRAPQTISQSLNASKLVSTIQLQGSHKWPSGIHK